MRRSVTVILRPHITDDRIAVMVRRVADRLWPGAAGAAQLITVKQIGKQLIDLALEVRKRGQALRLRAVRDGVTCRLEPIGVVDG